MKILLGGLLQMLITVPLSISTIGALNLGDKGDLDVISQENVKKKISATLKVYNETVQSVPDYTEEATEINTALLNKQVASQDGDDLLLLLTSSVSETRFVNSNNSDDFAEAFEELPEAQEFRYERPDKRKLPYRRYFSRNPAEIIRRNVSSDRSRSPMSKFSTRAANQKRIGPTTKECTFFTKTVCLEVIDYPVEAIIRSIQSNKEMVAALLADYKIQNVTSSAGGKRQEIFHQFEIGLNNTHRDRLANNELKRISDYPSDNVEEGFTCSSQIKYARPQLARAVSGIWKYIINTGEHTQTLRLEKCLNPHLSCSFISQNYRSSCVQVYNYHRLLTWDMKLGLHMDIFKVPTCCSCHVHGYADIYPPHENDPPANMKESFPGETFSNINLKIDFDDTDEDNGDDDDDDNDDNYDAKPSGKYMNKYNPALQSDNSFRVFDDHSSTFFTSVDHLPAIKAKTQIKQVSPSRSIYNIAGRKFKKPNSLLPRPYDKLPQHHAPNTRAPGYTGSFIKNTRFNRLNSPYRRESTSEMEDLEFFNKTSVSSRIIQPDDQKQISVKKKQNQNFNGNLQEHQTRINYNYHPIIDFFKPQTSVHQLKFKTQIEHVSPIMNANLDDTWKPINS